MTDGERLTDAAIAAREDQRRMQGHTRGDNGAAPNQDLVIQVKAPIGFPYHKWLAFSSIVQADVVKRMREHGLIEHVS